MRQTVLLLALLLALGACSASDDSGDSAAEKFESVEEQISSDETAADDGEAFDSSADDAPNPASTETEAGPGAATPTGLSAADIGRSIVFTGFVSVEVDDVVSASGEAVDAIEGIGGFVFGQETIGGAEASSTLVFKVAPNRFDEALELLGGVGNLQSQSVNADDVTDRVVDLEGRIATTQLGADRLRAAMEATTDLESFAELESLLLARESELELMRGQLRTLSDQVDLATITLTLTQDRTINNLEMLITLSEEHDDGLACPGDQNSRALVSGIDLTVCIELINTGDQTLTNLTLADTGLGIDSTTGEGDLIAVFGSIDEPLDPGQSIIVAHELVTDRDLRMRTRSGGQPTVGNDGEPAGPPVSTSQNSTVTVTQGDEEPGFGDGFEAGRQIVSGIWVATRVIAGFLIPMLILLPFIALAWVATRRLRAARAKRRAEVRAAKPVTMAPPPAPAPVATVAPQPPAPKTDS